MNKDSCPVMPNGVCGIAFSEHAEGRNPSELARPQGFLAPLEMIMCQFNPNETLFLRKLAPNCHSD